MRIGVNAYPLRTNGGGSRYLFAGLLSALLKLDNTHHYLIFAHLESLRLVYQILKEHGETLGGTGPDPRVKVIHTTDEGQIFAHRFEFDLLFGPLNNLNPRLYDRPTVAFLLDIQEQYFPEYFGKAELLGRQEVYPEICRSATTVVTISQFCKQSFIDKFGIDPRKIEVMPVAPQAELVNTPGDGVWTGEALPPKYLLYPANCYRHKNHALLLDAVARLRDEGLSIPTVFSGFEMPGGFPLKKEIAARGLGNLCSHFQQLPPAQLRYLYRHATALVMPTRFEGFGMPAVEAAACGCPVVCSDIPALREIVGDNALYFSPDNVDQLCERIRTIVNDAPLREGMIEKGFAIAARFTWENAGRQMLDIFREAGERFVWGPHKPFSVRKPRIGMLLRLDHGGYHAIQTVESLLCTGYGDLLIRCHAPPLMTESLRKFLTSAGVEIIEKKSPAHSNGDQSAPSNAYEDLRQFSCDHDLDIVGEIMEGHRLKISGLDSVAWGYLYEPDKPIHLAEAMEWHGKQFVGISRLRLTGDGLWKLEGYLYPEMMYINPRLLDLWPEGVAAVEQGQAEWRWELLRLARSRGKLLLSRRTVADTDRAILGPHAKRRAAKAGMFDYYGAQSEASVKVKLLRRVQPLVKRASLVLPLRWQDAGTRLWYHLAR